MRCFRVDSRGIVQISDLPRNYSDLSNKEVYLVVSDQKKRIYIWIGAAASVRSKFIGSQEAASLNRSLGLTYKISTEESLCMTKEFQKVFKERPSRTRTPSRVFVTSYSKEELQKIWEPLFEVEIKELAKLIIERKKKTISSLGLAKEIPTEEISLSNSMTGDMLSLLNPSSALTKERRHQAKPSTLKPSKEVTKSNVKPVIVAKSKQREPQEEKEHDLTKVKMVEQKPFKKGVSKKMKKSLILQLDTAMETVPKSTGLLQDKGTFDTPKLKAKSAKQKEPISLTITSVLITLFNGVKLRKQKKTTIEAVKKKTNCTSADVESAIDEFVKAEFLVISSKYLNKSKKWNPKLIRLHFGFE